LFIVSPEYRRLASFAEAAVSVADNSGTGDWEGELVDAGSGTSDSDYAGKDLKGKIALVSGSPYSALSQAVTKRGALGLVCYNPGNVDRPDQVGWIRIARGMDDPATFAFSISCRSGTALKEQLGNGRKLVLRAKVEAEFQRVLKTPMVEGWIRGRRRGQTAKCGRSDGTSKSDGVATDAPVAEDGVRV
jgi:hypothetical protein